LNLEKFALEHEAVSEPARFKFGPPTRCRVLSLNLRTDSAFPTLADMGEGYSSSHLPTRCPVCKAAGIFRMPSKSSGAVIWFYCDFCKHMWKVRIESDKHG
jgi:hypothetical protein